MTLTHVFLLTFCTSLTHHPALHGFSPGLARSSAITRGPKLRSQSASQHVCKLSDSLFPSSFSLLSSLFTLFLFPFSRPGSGRPDLLCLALSPTLLLLARLLDHHVCHQESSLPAPTPVTSEVFELPSGFLAARLNHLALRLTLPSHPSRRLVFLRACHSSSESHTTSPNRHLHQSVDHSHLVPEPDRPLPALWPESTADPERSERSSSVHLSVAFSWAVASQNTGPLACSCSG